MSFSDANFIRLKETADTNKKSEYVDSVLSRHWREIDKALTILSISGLTNEEIVDAITSVKLSALPVVGRQGRALARQLPGIGPLQDGDESVAYAIGLLAEEYIYSPALRQRLTK